MFLSCLKWPIDDVVEQTIADMTQNRMDASRLLLKSVLILLWLGLGNGQISK